MAMRLKRVKLFALLCLVAVMGIGGSAFASDYANPDAIVSADELYSLIEKGEVKVIDVRGGMKYKVGHIPGALNLDFGSFVDKSSPYPYMCPPKEQVEETLGALGLKNDDALIIYGDTPNNAAARVWWILDRYGHKNIKLLNGDIAAWESAGFNKEMLSPKIDATTYKINGVDNSKFASVEDVKAALDDPNVVILDVRSYEEYTGEKLLQGAKKAGRIPGAVWVEWTQALDEKGFFKSFDALKELYESKGVTPDKTIIVYCQGGYRAAHTTFVLHRLLGYPNVKNYDGAWVEWTALDLPVETGK